MRLLVLSDLHLEIDPHFVPPVRDAEVTLLVGDIHKGARAVAWARAQFAGRVLLVAGNHEFYGGHLTHTLRDMIDASDDRVRVLERDAVVIDGVRFLGATGWTDFAARGDRVAAQREALLSMNDYRRIRTGDWRRIRPLDAQAISKLTRAWLREKLAEPFAGPTVVLTHHAPSLRCLSGVPTPLDAAYANDWDDLLRPPVALWVHGHTHDPRDHVVGGVRVVCNPRGYPGEPLGAPFEAAKIVEVPS
jgi:predicted phosphodiesterase